MIRRQVQDDLTLVTQHDHAQLAGTLATHVGNRSFDTPSRHESWTRGVSLHDCGWPLHDDAPTLNSAGRPRDVFESTPAIGLKVWQVSADRAESIDPYAGLLVSLHSLSLSIMACSPNTGGKQEHFDQSDPHVRFAINKFQHREIERQEQLRGTLGLRTDIPLLHGLADPGVDGRDDTLTYHFRWLQALDLMSLALCCTEVPTKYSNDVHVKPNGKAVRFSMIRKNSTTLVVTPWPFDVPGIELEVPCRHVPDRAYATEAELHDAIRQAPPNTLDVSIQSS